MTDTRVHKSGGKHNMFLLNWLTLLGLVLVHTLQNVLMPTFFPTFMVWYMVSASILARLVVLCDLWKQKKVSAVLCGNKSFGSDFLVGYFHSFLQHLTLQCGDAKERSYAWTTTAYEVQLG